MAEGRAMTVIRPAGQMVPLNAGDPSLGRIGSLGVFADWRLPKDEDLRFVAETMRKGHGGWDRVILGIWPKNAPHGWVPRYEPEAIRERLRACKDAELDPVVMAWARRGDRAIREMCEWLKEATYHRTPLLLDAEGEWHRGDVAPGAAAAAAWLVLDLLKGETWGVTGLGQLHRTVFPLATLAHFVVPQCYSFWKPTGPHWSHSADTFPGHQQAAGHESWAEAVERADNTPEVIMGLGCYWAARPAQGLTPALTATQVMRAAVIETAALGIDSIWWWSLKWLRKRGKAGDEVRRFFGVGP
jgi:hypothetical protein